MMGNKIGKRRLVVDDKYTRPQGLYQHRDIDHKKLRKLILESKLAPCYPGLDDYSFNLEECPICFLYYPSLNRSRCCMKGICTECFLQMKPPHSTRPTQCPFCKTSNYAVEYRGAKTKEEKGLEQVEEQKLIEAQIRIRQQELQDESERMKKRQNLSSSCTSTAQIDVGHVDRSNISVSVEPLKNMRQLSDFGSYQASSSAPTSARLPLSRQNRDDNFDLDLEDIMIMEAVWLSIQEQGSKGNLHTAIEFSPGSSASVERYNSGGTAPVTLSYPGGLASAAAALAERQQMNDDSAVENYQSSPNTRHEEHDRCLADCQTRVAKSGTRYAGSGGMVEAVGTARPPPEGSNVASGSFEEQMMLAMAVSLADAQTRQSNHGISHP